MNKAVLISIRPQWCELIASGKKTVDIRKNAPKLPTPFKCYIYCTKARSAAEVLTPCNNLSDVRNGKVLGEFVCDAIYTVDAERSAYLREAFDGISSDEFLQQARLTAYDLLDYLAAEATSKVEYMVGYGWHISDLVIYAEPKELGEFYRWWDDGDDIRPCQNGKRCQHLIYDYTEDCQACAIDFDGTDCPYLKVTRPPQSWCYVETLGGDA